MNNRYTLAGKSLTIDVIVGSLLFVATVIAYYDAKKMSRKTAQFIVNCIVERINVHN